MVKSPNFLPYVPIMYTAEENLTIAPYFIPPMAKSVFEERSFGFKWGVLNCELVRGWKPLFFGGSQKHRS